MKHSKACFNLKKDSKESNIYSTLEITPQEKEFYIAYKQKLEYKLYERFKTNILNQFTSHLGDKSAFINLAFGIVSCFDDFIKLFGSIIYSNFDLNNTNFEDFWQKIAVEIEEVYKQEFFKRLKKLVLEKELNKSMTSWNLLQYNDYKNFIYDLSGQNKNKKIKQNFQRHLLDDQIKRKLELRKEAEEAIERIAKFSCLKNKSTSEILYEQLLIDKNNKIKEELENAIFKKSLTNNIDRKNNKNLHFIKEEDDKYTKTDKLDLPVSISINNTVNHFYKNANESKVNKTQKNNIIDNQIGYGANYLRDSFNNDVRLSNQSNFFNNYEKSEVRKNYLKVIEKQNNYGKSDKIKDFDYVKDCVKLDKHMLYSLRNTSNIFFESS